MKNIRISYLKIFPFCKLSIYLNRRVFVMRTDNSVKNWRNLPISNPRPDPHNITAHTKFGENHWYLLKLSSGNENMTMSRADNTVRIDKICPLAMPNQISKISVHSPSFVKIHWYIHMLSSRRKYGRTDVITTDGRTDGHTDNQRDIPSISFYCYFQRK